MKFSKYLMMAGAAAMLTACSSEEPFVPTGSPMTEEIANNDSYAMISLALAEDGGTRAAQPATSDVPSEYKVKNGKIFIFKKSKEANATEGDATFVGDFTFTSNWVDITNPQDISRTSTFTMSFPKGTFETNETYGACVVLNYPNNYPTPKEGDKFSKWAWTASSVEFLYTVDGTQYMTMVSAPQAAEDKKSYSVLVEIPASKIKKSMAEVSAADAIDGFFVHRNAAKLELKTKTTDHKYTIESGAYKDAVVTVNTWDADITAKQSYPIQNVDGLDLEAKNMVAAAGNFPNFRRINWAKGVFYAKDANISNAFNKVTESSLPTEFKKYKYVKENTMVAKAQVENRTTRMVLKATYKTSENEPAKTLVKVGNAVELMTSENFVAAVKAKATGINNVDVAIRDEVTAGGYYSLKGLCEIKSGTAEITDAQYKAIAEELGLKTATEEEISYYVGGVCYYTILVRHFDDIEQGLGEGVTITKADDYDDVAHLGRYGVLRNNWYEINVDKITKIGEPVIPTPGTDPDDKPSDEVQALAFTIKMLNWSKRSQNVNL